MSVKRDHDSVDEGEVSEPDAKRSKKPGQSKKQRQHQTPNSSAVDPTWGQRYVFSGSNHATTIPVGEESDFEDDADAMAYLKSVRHEAHEIPRLLVAPKIQIGPQLPDGHHNEADAGETENGDFPDGEAEDDEADEGEDAHRDYDETAYDTYDPEFGDARGYYDDGAYVAAPVDDEDGEYGVSADSGEEGAELSSKAVCEAYYQSLVQRFEHARRILQSQPPPKAVSSLPKHHPTYAAPFGRDSPVVGMWSRALRDTDPNPVQVAQMSKDSVLRVLSVMMRGNLLVRGCAVAERTSRWIWALLARLPERGEMNHLDIGWVRDLGRRAVLLGTSMSDMVALREELEDGGLGVHEGVDAENGADADRDEARVVPDAVAKIDEATESNANMPSDKKQQKRAPTLQEQTLEPQPQSPPAAHSDLEDGEVAMDTASDSSGEQGEDYAEPGGDADSVLLEDAKARLLASLEHGQSDPEAEDSTAEKRSELSTRATLSMVLTIAGEIYGQRDLLEFREPFAGM